jgi:hypothetical protein
VSPQAPTAAQAKSALTAVSQRPPAQPPPAVERQPPGGDCSTADAEYAGCRDGAGAALPGH